jgi:hypothetical protein
MRQFVWVSLFCSFSFTPAIAASPTWMDQRSETVREMWHFYNRQGHLTVTNGYRAYIAGADSSGIANQADFVAIPTDSSYYLSTMRTGAPVRSGRYNIYRISPFADSLVYSFVYLNGHTIGKSAVDDTSLVDQSIGPDKLKSLNVQGSLYAPLSDGNGSFLWAPMSIAIADTMILNVGRYTTYRGGWCCIKVIPGLVGGNIVVWSFASSCGYFTSITRVYTGLPETTDSLIVDLADFDCQDCIISYMIGIATSVAIASATPDSNTIADHTIAPNDINVAGSKIPGYLMRVSGTNAFAVSAADSVLFANGSLSPHDLWLTGTLTATAVLGGTGTTGAGWHEQTAFTSLGTTGPFTGGDSPGDSLAFPGTITSPGIRLHRRGASGVTSLVGQNITNNVTVTPPVVFTATTNASHNGRGAVYVPGMTSGCTVVPGARGSITGVPGAIIVVTSACKTDSLVFWASEWSSGESTFVPSSATIKYAYTCP